MNIFNQVISIAGLYRTGKSFILNKLAGSNRGFSIGATIEPCTEGIHMWIKDADELRSKYQIPSNISKIILLDTEVRRFNRFNPRE
jgi:hypothetical protein